MNFSDETKIISSIQMVGHGVGLEMENALDVNMSIRL